MALNQKAIKVLGKVFEAGFTDEKSIAAMTMDDILAIQGITIADIGIINELQKSIKANITSRVRTKAKLPTHTAIKDFEGLSKDSVILLEQIRTIDKKRLREHIGMLDSQQILTADNALLISLGLDKKD